MTRHGLVIAGLQLGGLVALSALRNWQHQRRTGQSGVRLPDGGLADRVGGLAFAAGLGAATLGTLQSALGRGRVADRPVAGGTLMVAGMTVAAVAQSGMGDQWRIGVDPDEQTDLVTSGIFGLARNPIFSGVMLASMGAFVAAPRVLTGLGAALSVLGCELQVRLVEEPHLERLHGAGYRDYTARVGRFVPLLGRRGRSPVES